MQITEIAVYDKKRKKIVLEEGAECFLLYLGELRRLHLNVGEEMSETQYQEILRDILIPRARKKALYLLKNSDRTRAQLVRKLREGFYPQMVIDDVLSFLEQFHFVDDSRYAERYVEHLKESRSRREIAAKLYQRGVCRETAAEQMESLTEEDEESACLKVLRQQYGRKLRQAKEALEALEAEGLEPAGRYSYAGRYGHGEEAGAEGLSEEDSAAACQAEAQALRRKAYAYLARRGFSYDAINHAFLQLEEE